MDRNRGLLAKPPRIIQVVECRDKLPRLTATDDPMRSRWFCPSRSPTSTARNKPGAMDQLRTVRGSREKRVGCLRPEDLWSRGVRWRLREGKDAPWGRNEVPSALAGKWDNHSHHTLLSHLENCRTYGYPAIRHRLRCGIYIVIAGRRNRKIEKLFGKNEAPWPDRQGRQSGPLPQGWDWLDVLSPEAPCS